MVADSIFIDTNVLVFATIPSSPFHRPALAALHRLTQDGATGWISRQVMREYLVQITRPGVLPAGSEGRQGAAQVNVLTTLYRVADETSHVSHELLALIRKGMALGKQVHDANIVATCLANGIPRLLTHNVQDFKRYASLITVETI